MKKGAAVIVTALIVKPILLHILILLFCIPSLVLAQKTKARTVPPFPPLGAEALDMMVRLHDDMTSPVKGTPEFQIFMVAYSGPELISEGLKNETTLRRVIYEAFRGRDSSHVVEKVLPRIFPSLSRTQRMDLVGLSPDALNELTRNFAYRIVAETTPAPAYPALNSRQADFGNRLHHDMTSNHDEPISYLYSGAYGMEPEANNFGAVERRAASGLGDSRNLPALVRRAIRDCEGNVSAAVNAVLVNAFPSLTANECNDLATMPYAKLRRLAMQYAWHIQRAMKN